MDARVCFFKIFLCLHIGFRRQRTNLSPQKASTFQKLADLRRAPLDSGKTRDRSIGFVCRMWWILGKVLAQSVRTTA